MLIDVLVIKKHSEDKIKKNIGNIFRRDFEGSDVIGTGKKLRIVY